MANTILIVDDSKLARIVAGRATKALQPLWGAAGGEQCRGGGWPCSLRATST